MRQREAHPFPGSFSTRPHGIESYNSCNSAHRKNLTEILHGALAAKPALLKRQKRHSEYVEGGSAAPCEHSRQVHSSQWRAPVNWALCASRPWRGGAHHPPGRPIRRQFGCTAFNLQCLLCRTWRVRFEPWMRVTQVRLSPRYQHCHPKVRSLPTPRNVTWIKPASASSRERVLRLQRA